MRFFEYESRAIVAQAGIPVTEHGFATSAEQARAIAQEIGGPVVIKSQVLAGGRMKAGGVQFADTPEQAFALLKPALEAFLDSPGHSDTEPQRAFAPDTPAPTAQALLGPDINKTRP